MVAFWKRRRENPLALYFFCLGGVVFLGHLAWSLHSRILQNWIAPAVLPMFCLMVIYWDARWREGARAVKSWLIAGLILGLPVVALMHDTDLIGKIAGHAVAGRCGPAAPGARLPESAAAVEQAREKLLSEGKPAFIICGHYGITGLFTFYLPEARTACVPQPLVYCITSDKPNNQFYFWPEYRYPDRRKGENAIYVTEPGRPKLESGWFWKWLGGREVSAAEEPKPVNAPPRLVQQFESVTNLGVREIKVDGRVMKRIQLFECRNLR